MKKYITLVLAIIMLLSLSACSKGIEVYEIPPNLHSAPEIKNEVIKENDLEGANSFFGEVKSIKIINSSVVVEVSNKEESKSFVVNQNTSILDKSHTAQIDTVLSEGCYIEVFYKESGEKIPVFEIHILSYDGILIAQK